MREIRRLDARAKELSRRTGIPHVVDHEIPLTHKYVCGLNVHHNMQVIPKAVNAAKSNAWCDGLQDMFSEPEQFSLWVSRAA